MGNLFFHFKKFVIHQQHVAMKVCTDACLFGSLLPKDESIKKALDIGAGTGLLSLMYAQKNNAAKIDAIEIDADAALDARLNINDSPWHNNITFYAQDIHNFALIKARYYDLIFANPPFYENDFPSPKQKNNTAHHSAQLTLAQLTSIVAKLLKTGGTFAVLLPYQRKDYFINKMIEINMSVFRSYIIKQTPAHKPFRCVLFFQHTPQNCIEEEIIIKNINNKYTQIFKELLKDYYLYL